jgi:hypothetical protein
MRRFVIALVLLLVLAAGGWLAVQGLNLRAERKAFDTPWPLEAGPARAAASRYPDQETSEAARELTRLAAYFRIPLAPRREGDVTIAEPLKRDLEPYVQTHLARPSFAIDPAPPLLSRIFATSQFAAIRERLLRGEPIAWPVRFTTGGPMPNLTGHVTLHRLLIASALDRARRGDAGAWEDLRASRELNRSLWSRPELLSHVVALQVTRSAVAAARKLPPPAPAWFEEMLAEEMEPRFVRSLQADLLLTASTRALQIGRDTTEQAVASRACAVDGRAFDARVAEHEPPEELPSMGSTWQRIARYRAEREATRIALAVRAGVPPPLASVCSDRSWKVDGGMVRLNAPLPEVRKDLTIALEVPQGGRP